MDVANTSVVIIEFANYLKINGAAQHNSVQAHSQKSAMEVLFRFVVFCKNYVILGLF